jgi:hypothetical protein
MTRLAALCASAVVLAACAERPSVDDAALHYAIVRHESGAEVTFDGTVDGPPEQVSDHQRMRVITPQGDRVEVDHNVKLAPSVPAHAGDHVVVHGRLYLDPGQVGVHCTHAHTSAGCPYPGWVELGGNYYE